jgi:hypothetical protein
MAKSQDSAASLNDSKQAFSQFLTKALKSRGNLLILARCAKALQLNVVEKHAQTLVTEGGVITDIDRGRALWGLLREAIERLQPASAGLELTPAWRLYSIARGLYIQGKSTQAMVAELSLSQRTFYRERRAAVEALATIVWQIEKLNNK